MASASEYLLMQIGVFYDEWLRRHMLVVSIHAPHDSKEPYKLLLNLNYFVAKTLDASTLAWDSISHVVFAGDFNRPDWDKDRSLSAPHALKLQSAQGGLNGTFSTIDGKPFDNVLYGSRLFKYTLELAQFARHDKKGSDHHAVEAMFRA